MGALLNAELRGWKPGAVHNGLAPGDTATTGLTLTGIAVGDEIRKALYIPATGVPVNVLAEITVSGADEVKCASTNTTNGVVDVEWLAAAAL